MLQAMEERGGARADESRVGAPSPPAAVLPSPPLQTAIEDGGEGSSEGRGGLPAEASIISGRAASERVCSMCGGPPAAPSGDVVKLKACARCMSVRYCSQECQKGGTGGRAATRRHAHSCGRGGRGGRGKVRETERLVAGCRLVVVECTGWVGV